MENSAKWIPDDSTDDIQYERITDMDFTSLKCYKCHETLKHPGALLISPPFEWHGIENCTVKYHICSSCYSKLHDIDEE